MDLILASTSPYRRLLLERLGVPFLCVNPGVDEDAFKARGLAPHALAEALALAKAMAAAREYPEAVVVGSDQIATFGGTILGKPGTVEAAEAQLAAMSGRTHQLVTAVAVVRPAGPPPDGERFVDRHIDVTTLLMRPLSADEIRRYVEADRPLDCAGSYKIESRGVALFERIDSADHTAIVGLPLVALTTILRGIGFAIP